MHFSVVYFIEVTKRDGSFCDLLIKRDGSYVDITSKPLLFCDYGKTATTIFRGMA